jgi:hypothetical protein
MKKRLLKKVLSAFVILAVSSCLINMHGQVKVIFENGDDRDDRQQGIAGRDALHLNYTIDGSGNIALDAVTPATDPGIIAFVDSWDLADAGTTDVASLFGKSFSLVLTTNGKRLDCREKGGLGIQGMNSGRIDDAGKEILYITLEGSVGINFDSLMYEPTERGGGDDASFVLKDYDTDSLFYLPATGDSVFIAGDSVWVADTIVAFEPGVLDMRFASDVLTVSAPDSLGSAGGRLLGLFFTLMEPTNPAVARMSPVPGDTLLDISSDFVILFNMPMNTATTEAAVSFTPALTNRVNTWNGDGDTLTITSDDLDFYTPYTLDISTAAESADGRNPLVSFNYAYQTLPDPPTVLDSYPVTQGKEVPLNTPLAIQFIRPMNTDSVELSISFEPELTGLKFVWSEDQSLVYLISDAMENISYTVTVSTVATDIWGVQMAAPYTFDFKANWPTSIEDLDQSDVVIYPNPTSDILNIRGMDVASVRIYNLTGQLIKEVYNTSVINVSDVEPGSYALIVSDRADKTARKMIVVE